MAGKSHVLYPSYTHVSVPYLLMLSFYLLAIRSPLLLPPPYPPSPGMGFPYERGENARRLF